MWSWPELVVSLSAWSVPFGSAVIGALTGGLVTWLVGRGESRRQQRERYGQALLDAMGSARVATQTARAAAYAVAAAYALGHAPEWDETVSPVILRREARDILVNAELAAALERGRDARLSIKGWALHHHESLLAGCEQIDDLQWLDEQLQLGEFLVVAWMAGDAKGVDFARDKATVVATFGPKYSDQHIPDYAQRIHDA